ncbi:PadR family transcriptional regulator, partial [Klebsiella pneumoniae]|uniref:PadR family transcriptional regulator n=1 Tax=Klebsiella pneumoniae TaxID=573 RepID=UPI00406AB67B
MTDKDLYGGLIRLHILHHAAEEPVFGLGIIEELRRHGYEMSAGTVYPMLHGLEKKGYLTSRHERTGRRERRVYDITEQGRTALADAKTKVKELFGELVEGGVLGIFRPKTTKCSGGPAVCGLQRGITFFEI